MSKTPPKEKDAPADGDAGAEGEVPAKKKPPILLIGIAAAAVLVLGGGGATAFMLLKPKPAASDAAKAKKPAKKPAKDAKGKDGKDADKSAGTVREGPDGVTFYTLPDLVVNIQSDDGKPTFLKLKLTFELSDPDEAATLDEAGPRLQDMFTSFLRELRPDDLNGSQGTYELRQELQRRVNLVIAPQKVNAVLIEEMLVQ